MRLVERPDVVARPLVAEREVLGLVDEEVDVVLEPLDRIDMEVLGGVGEWVASEIRTRTEKDTRSLVLGHLQRGGSPTTFDRLLALRFGAAAVRLVGNKVFDHMVALKDSTMISVPIADAIRKRKKVDINSDKVMTARDIGICLGDKDVRKGDND